MNAAKPMPVSAVLIVKDGEPHLDRVLAALAWCDDILVLDSGSTDRTVAIARERGARVAHQEFLGYGRQKQRAVELARHDWVLVIDADEVMDDHAANAIRALDLSDATRAWRIRRRTYIGTREVRHGQWSPDYSLRLFNRTKAGFDLVAVHEAVRTAGPILTLPGSLHHYSYQDHAEVFTRLASYARMKSWDYRQSGRRAGAFKLVMRAFWGFFRSYVLKRGFLDGVDGVIVAMSLALDCVLALALADGPPPVPPPVRGNTTVEGVPPAAKGSATTKLLAVSAVPGQAKDPYRAESSRSRRTGFILEAGVPYGLPESGQTNIEPDEEAILAYLEKGPVIAQCLDFFEDPFNGEPMGGTQIHDDGVWEWPSYLPIFRRRHHIRLEPEFITYIRAQISGAKSTPQDKQS